MSVNFATVVENVQSLSFNDKFELKELLDKYLIEERRDEIYQNYLLASETKAVFVDIGTHDEVY